jgi:hypothetical protein
MTPHQRTRVLLKLAELVDKFADELAEPETSTMASWFRKPGQSISM